MLPKLLTAIKGFLYWLMPNGLGTKAVLALVVVAFGLPLLQPDDVKTVVLVVISFYFTLKATNGGTTPNT